MRHVSEHERLREWIREHRPELHDELCSSRSKLEALVILRRATGLHDVYACDDIDSSCRRFLHALQGGRALEAAREVAR